ncbi:unnamed protein product [Rhizophagus irregularis]|uniref:Uncharacterized protein n=7 Tax=Rhizophagus irregularis TaxID=588596 RepID=A0A915ZW63_9GLOM|nr:unnamed protein product [Rhizophagus irregularis]CAB5393389.1 unnamed protein product [Rhizophagus irregularis]
MSDKDRSGNSKGSQANEKSSKKSKNSAEGSSNGNNRNEIPFQGLSPETQKLIESIKNNNSSPKRKDVPNSMVEEILREAKLKAASRGIDINHGTKSSRDENRKNSKHIKPIPSVVASSRNFAGHNDDILSELDHDDIILKHGAKDSGSFMSDEFDDKIKSKKISEEQQQQQKTDITKNNGVSQPNRSQSRSYLPTRLASLIGIGTGDNNVTDESNSNADNNKITVDNSSKPNIEEPFELENDDKNVNVKSLDSSNKNNNSKDGPGVTIDTNVERSNRKEQRYIVRPRLTKKRAVIRRASARLVQPSSNDYQRSSKSPLKTVEISNNELDEINAQFEETLNQFSKRYQDSTVALAEKSHLLKRNQELHHNLASKEEEIEYLKNELWEAGNKIQNYESDLKDIIEQQLEPLTLTHEDLVRIEREMEDQEVLIGGYQKENDKLVNEIKSLNERLRISDLEQEKQLNKTHELYGEIDHLKELLYERETQETVPEGTIQQIDELKKEIERLKEKEKTYEFKELALKGMDDLKKELSDLRDRESEYMIKIDDMEHQLSLARDEIDAVSQERMESLEKMTEEMNIMKFTYESQIEGVKKDVISKDGRETRFKKLQGAIEKIESKLNSNPEITQICTDLRRGNLLPPKKRRKSAADGSKNIKEPTTPRSPTTKTLKKATSQSSLGGMSRASAVTSPTPSVLSSVSAFSGKDDLMDLQEDDLIDITNEEFAEMKVKLMKSEKENQSSRETIEKLEDELKSLQEININLEKELETLKKDHAEKKEHYEQKMREMEELLLELPSADSTENSMAANNNPIPPQPAPNLIQDLETKQKIIEELVGKLKRKEEQLEYYQNAYLEKTEEFEEYVEKVKNANQSSTNGGTAVVNAGASTAPSGTEVTPNFDAFKFLSDALSFDDGIGDLSSLPITSDIMGLFGGLGDNQEISVIEKLIAQLERTIVERTMQLGAAHQRASDAESKLLALSREKMSWGSGYDTTVKQLKAQVEYLQELLQMERKVARKEMSDGTISGNDTTKSSNESKVEQVTKSTPVSTMDIQKLRSQIESLTAENITLKAELTTSEAIRQAIHENTLTILQQTTKTNLATDEDIAGLRCQSMEKEAEINVWKGRCTGLENVVERQRELLTLVVPSLPENKALDGKTRDITKILADDGIDSKVIEGLNETARKLVQQLREENAILRQTIVARQQIINKKVETPSAPIPVNPTTTSTTVQLEILAKQISEIETRFTKREKELQDIIVETKRQGELQLERWKAKWGAVIDKKNSEIRGFRNELESLMKCLGKLDSVKVNGSDNGVI